MQAIRLHGPGDLRLHQEPEPRPAPDEALVQVQAVGLCGSDLHWFAESGIGDARLERPLVLGHEAAGVLAGGQRVAIDPSVPCERCELCLTGHPNLCQQQRFAGHAAQDGALCERMAWPERYLLPLPDTFDAVDGVMLEPLGVALHAVDLAHLRPGMTIGVFGCGPIGLLILQLARLSGATQIIATERLAHRLDAARALGASLALPAADGREEAAALLAATHQRGVDVAFEVAGDDLAVQAALHSTRPGGKVMLIGIPADDRTTFNASTARRKGLTLKLVRRMKHTYPRAIQLVARGMVDVRSLVTHRFPLAQAPQAFQIAQRREGIKVIIQPSSEGVSHE